MRRADVNIAPVERQGQLAVGLNLEDRDVWVIGGDREAGRRVRALLAAGARVTVLAPHFSKEIELRGSRGEIELRTRKFSLEDHEKVFAVVVVDRTDPGTEGIVERCRELRVLVHVTDDARLSDFVFPAVMREGPLQVAIATGGVGPALAARVRDLVRESISVKAPGIGSAIDRFGLLRRMVRAADPGAPSEERMRWLSEFANKHSIAELSALTEAQLAVAVQEYMGGCLPKPLGDEVDAGTKQTASSHPPPIVVRNGSEIAGRVQLVGAGPGDPGLLTVAAREALEEADLVLADRLVPASILDLVRGELRLARKLPGRADLAQDELMRWTLDAAHAGRRVVRLKCGDPFLFGRGREELTVLRAAGIEPEILPGISSALAGPLLGGIAVTERNVADRVVISTGHGAADREVDLPQYRSGTTYVFLMAVRELESITERLIASGFPRDLPVALVERAGWDEGRTLFSHLARVPGHARNAGVQAPAVFVLGAAVGRAAEDAPAQSVPVNRVVAAGLRRAVGS